MDNNRVTNFKNGAVFYRVYGSGKAVILIHGFGENGEIWTYISAKLKNNFLVIVPDLPGSGRSSILKEQDEQISIESYADVILHIIITEGLEECVVIGHSMGGYIALTLAEKNPGLLKGLGLFNSTAFADDEDKKSARLNTIEFLQNNDPELFLKTSIPALFSKKFRLENYDEINHLSGSYKNFSSEALIQYCYAMINRPVRISVLQSKSFPVLFIIGEKDPVIPLEKSLTQCHLPVVSYVHILPGMGHMGMLEEKDLCAAMVLEYLEGVWEV